ncbi:hypothetical protein BDV95DRAFT_224414 [Massariosphaeria phaeospora]|uniref:Uncharacterized protein n=1 Tax=Massariosphaeria phaeospora TaxID=100035 RepID=A0A7C8IHC8_9PLEO|nr:hypothetical protein BDV95DRAFT_224414 [Massariosphaeria phaeospora]
MRVGCGICRSSFATCAALSILWSALFRKLPGLHLVFSLHTHSHSLSQHYDSGIRSLPARSPWAVVSCARPHRGRNPRARAAHCTRALTFTWAPQSCKCTRFAVTSYYPTQSLQSSKLKCTPQRSVAANPERTHRPHPTTGRCRTNGLMLCNHQFLGPAELPTRGPGAAQSSHAVAHGSPPSASPSLRRPSLPRSVGP